MNVSHFVIEYHDEREREREHNFPIHDLQSSQRFGT